MKYGGCTRRITRYSIGTSALSISLGSGASKIIFQAGDADVFIAYDESDFDINQFFTILAGSTLVLDQPIPNQDELIYVKANSSTTIEVWIT